MEFLSHWTDRGFALKVEGVSVEVAIKGNELTYILDPFLAHCSKLIFETIPYGSFAYLDCKDRWIISTPKYTQDVYIPVSIPKWEE